MGETGYNGIIRSVSELSLILSSEVGVGITVAEEYGGLASGYFQHVIATEGMCSCPPFTHPQPTNRSIS